MDPSWTLILGGSVCKSMRNLVGASGFEPPTSWSRTRMTKRINNLDVDIAIETDLDLLFHQKNLRRTAGPSVFGSRNVSMHGVGIVLGIVGWCGWGETWCTRCLAPGGTSDRLEATGNTPGRSSSAVRMSRVFDWEPPFLRNAASAVKKNCMATLNGGCGRRDKSEGHAVGNDARIRIGEFLDLPVTAGSEPGTPD